MHVNSQMPFSVYFKTFDDTIIRASNDITIKLEHDELLATPESEIMTVKKGDYYAWSVLYSHGKIGNTFIRAIHEESGLDVAKSIKVSSTLPTGLKLSVFPKLIPAEYDRNLDIFVTVVDADGNPTKTPEDIPLEFFSNEQFPIGDVLDKISQTEKAVIKKGQFGNLLHEKFSLQNLLKNDILISVSSEGYGTATDIFRTVGELIDEGNKLKRTLKNVFNFGFNVKDYGNTVNLFGLDSIPSNSTSFFTCQLSMIEDDEDDDGIRPDGTEIEINPECAKQSDDRTSSNSEDITHNTELDSDEMILYSIDC